MVAGISVATAGYEEGLVRTHMRGCCGGREIWDRGLGVVDWGGVGSQIASSRDFCQKQLSFPEFTG